MSDLHPETLAQLVKLARESQAANLLKIPGDPRKLLIDQGGKHELYDLPFPPAAFQVETVESFLKAVERFAGDGIAKVTVWVNSDAVVAVLNSDAWRDSRIILPLAFTPAWDSARDLNGPMKQRALVYAIRTAWRGCVAESLANTFKTIEFKRRSDGQSTVEHGRESLGKSVEASVQGTTALPEFIQFDAQLFDVPDFTIRGQLAIVVTPLPDTEEFGLCAVPDEVRREEAGALAILAKDLRDALKECAVLIGTP